MIGLGASQWLWWLPPVWAVALALHLYFRRKRRSVQFSDVGLLRRDEHFPAMRRILRDYLRLLIRLLILTLPILALAQPRLSGVRYLSEVGQRRVILLDDSFSMERKLPSGESAFEAAKKIALDLIEAFEDGDTALLFSSATPGVTMTNNRDRLRQGVQSAEIHSPASTLGAGLDEAEQLIGVSEIFVISDFQKSMLGRRKHSGNTSSYALALRGREDNLAVEIASGASLPPIVGVEQPFKARVRSYSTQPEEARVEFRCGGRKIAERQVSLAPGESQELDFTFSPATGITSGSVTVEDSNVTHDNTVAFSFRAEKILKVGLVKNTALEVDPFYFLRCALDPRGDTQRGMLLEELRPVELTAERLREFQLVMVAGELTSSPELETYVRTGGRLWQLPSVTDKPSPSGKSAHFAGDLAVLNEELQLELIGWRRLAELLPQPNDVTLLALEDGTPLLLERPEGTGKRYLAGFDLRSRSSSWPLLRSFPVAMAKLVSYMALPGGSDTGPGLTSSEAITPESDLVMASESDIQRALPGIRELRLDGSWKQNLEHLREGRPLAGWLLLIALLLWGVDAYLGKEEAR